MVEKYYVAGKHKQRVSVGNIIYRVKQRGKRQTPLYISYFCTKTHYMYIFIIQIP